MDRQPRILYRLLERPQAYERLQHLFGAAKARRRFVSEMLRPWPGAALLDIGCGTGSLLEHLPREVHYTGFDLNARYIEAARNAWAGRATFLVGRAGEERNRFGEGTFDIVVAKALLHHIDDRSAESMLGNARDLLRGGGVFVAIDPVLHGGQNALSRLLVSLDRGRYVRRIERHRELIETHFEIVESRLITDLLRLPYSHHFVRAVPRK